MIATTMSNIDWLEKWYLSFCDDDWEHRYGIKITTLDNPGWSVTIDLRGTPYLNTPFIENRRDGEVDWIVCRKKEESFEGFGGAENLDEIIGVFRNWVQTLSQATVQPLSPTPRARVLAMPEYHPPLASRAMLRLDFNENTFAPSPRVTAKLNAITAEGLTIYPERELAELGVAAHFNLAPDQVLLTNGVDEAIHLLCCTFLEEGDEALIATPTFFMYDVSVGLMTSGIVRVQSDDSLEFPRDRFLAAITPKTKLIMVASPNNPTGKIVPRADLLAICAAAPHAVVFVDEAYYHFHGETTLTDVDHIKNLIVGRTFSKAYGLANLRLGMLAGDAKLLRFVRKVASPYNVNGIALAVLPEALADQQYLDWYVAQVSSGRDRVMTALDELGVRYWKSAANFVLFEIGPRHKELVARMREKGVLLRDRSTDPGCEGYVRITIGIEDHVTRGIEALRETLKEMQWTR